MRAQNECNIDTIRSYIRALPLFLCNSRLAKAVQIKFGTKLQYRFNYFSILFSRLICHMFIKKLVILNHKNRSNLLSTLSSCKMNTFIRYDISNGFIVHNPCQMSISSSNDIICCIKSPFSTIWQNNSRVFIVVICSPIPWIITNNKCVRLASCKAFSDYVRIIYNCANYIYVVFLNPIQPYGVHYFMSASCI